MPLLNSYVIWNNKGGVGKSTICFHLASRYAERNPTHQVLAIDLCPQSNVSQMLLGGGTQGETRVLALATHTPLPRTVLGYMSAVLSGGPGAPLPAWNGYVIQPRSQNGRIPANLHLLCGDGNLEPAAPLISSRANQAPLPPAMHPWVWVHTIISRLIQDVTAQDARNWVVFVDTNPSFSIYTEIAVSGASRLIVPVNADDASRAATNAMFTLIWGTQPPHPVYGTYTYAAQAATHHLPRPLVHLIVGNRLTQYVGTAAAFGAISDETTNSLFSAFQQHPTRFSPQTVAVNTMAEFRNALSVPLRDFNTAGVVAAHLGTPLSQLVAGWHRIYAQDVRVNGGQIAACQGAIDQIVARV